MINFKNNITLEDIEEEISDYWTITNKITNTQYTVFKYAYRLGIHKFVNNDYIFTAWVTKKDKLWFNYSKLHCTTFTLY
jgi:hypothetical protein